MEENAVILYGCDVILFEDEAYKSLNGHLTLVSRLLKAGYVTLNNGNPVTDKQLFSDEGIRCVVLQSLGEGWEQGTLRFRVEFTPDKLPEKKEPSLPNNFDDNFGKEWS